MTSLMYTYILHSKKMYCKISNLTNRLSFAGLALACAVHIAALACCGSGEVPGLPCCDIKTDH